MASTLRRHASREPEREIAAAVIDERELEESRHDPRVRAFLAEADEYLLELERQHRNG